MPRRVAGVEPPDLVDVLPGLVWTCASGGRCVSVNARWRVFTGASSDALADLGWFGHVHPDDHASVDAAWAAAAPEGDDLRFKCRLRRHDGTWRWFETVAAAVTDNGSARWTLISTDVDDATRMADRHRADRERIARVVETVQMVFCSFELYPDGRVTMPYASPGIEEIYGLPAEQLRDDASAIFAVYHPDDVGRIQRSIQHSANTLTMWYDEFRVCRPGRPEIWVAGRSMPEALPDGRIHWDGFIADVTARKQADIAASIWKAAFEQAGLGIGRVDVATNRFLEINEAYASLLGYTREQIVGQPISLLYPPEAFAQVREIIAEADRVGHAAFEPSYRHADGHLVPVRVDVSVIYDEARRPVSRVAFVKDLTARRHAEATARLWERAFEQADISIALADITGRIQAVNPAFARSRGYTPEELVGQPATLIVGLDERQRIAASLAQGVDHRVTETVHRRKDGSEFPVRADVTAIRDEDDVLLANLGFVQDLTAQREAERVRRESEEALQRLNAELEQRVTQRTAQLEAANRELEAFAYSVSHDLRAPLRGIDGWSLALLEDCGDELGDQGRAHLRRVRGEATRMDRLIDDLLRFSRVGRVALSRVDTDVTALVGRVVERVREANPERALRFDIAPGLAAKADPQLLDVVFTNLLENATKFTRRRPEAHIEVAGLVDLGLAGFFVRDNGVGFDPAYAEGLFAAFKRLHKASEYPGTGIGLATVQRIVHRHGGRVWAESRVDEGATFSFTLGDA